jgi:hypothetical protein
MKKMKNKVIEIAKEQYLSNKEWRKKIFKNSDILSDDEILEWFCFGCNYPPSQFQLHLQSMYRIYHYYYNYYYYYYYYYYSYYYSYLVHLLLFNSMVNHLILYRG